LVSDFDSLFVSDLSEDLSEDGEELEDGVELELA
jgi:hypothetical protein